MIQLYDSDEKTLVTKCGIYPWQTIFDVSIFNTVDYLENIMNTSPFIRTAYGNASIVYIEDFGDKYTLEFNIKSFLDGKVYNFIFPSDKKILGFDPNDQYFKFKCIKSLRVGNYLSAFSFPYHDKLNHINSIIFSDLHQETIRILRLKKRYIYGNPLIITNKLNYIESAERVFCDGYLLKNYICSDRIINRNVINIPHYYVELSMRNKDLIKCGPYYLR